MKKFNSFDKSIQFTIDRFEDGIVHYPDIKINGSETLISSIVNVVIKTISIFFTKKF